MSALPQTLPDPTQVLATALLNAGRELGLTQNELASIIGRERTVFARRGIDPATKAGELALLLIRAYRSLFVLVGGDNAQMKHWMHTPNLHTGGTPAEQVHSVQGLIRVVEYLDAMRGKV
ncbi:MAG: MbcA/ParS/Xre antitoxin family protein [Moraxellaceae bacterium]|nr:MbcA/ParS/Xre antitoxin family protein [Moraxellaceae bacterium]